MPHDPGARGGDVKGVCFDDLWEHSTMALNTNFSAPLGWLSREYVYLVSDQAANA
jgi:hypothetical protein